LLLTSTFVDKPSTFLDVPSSPIISMTYSLYCWRRKNTYDVFLRNPYNMIVLVTSVSYQLLLTQKNACWLTKCFWEQ